MFFSASLCIIFSLFGPKILHSKTVHDRTAVDLAADIRTAAPAHTPADMAVLVYRAAFRVGIRADTAAWVFPPAFPVCSPVDTAAACENIRTSRAFPVLWHPNC